MPEPPCDATVPGRWVDAGDLREGDLLLLRDGRRATIEALSSRHTSEPVYNFAVAELSCYAAGGVQALVHNNSGQSPNGLKPVFREDGSLLGFEDSSGRRLSTVDAWDHIVDHLQQEQPGKGNDFHVGSREQALELVQDILGGEARLLETYADFEGTKVYQDHPPEMPWNPKHHLRYMDRSTGASGHIFYGQPAHGG